MDAKQNEPTTKLGRTLLNAVHETEKLLDDTFERLNPDDDRDGWFITRITKIREAIADRPTDTTVALHVDAARIAIEVNEQLQRRIGELKAQVQKLTAFKAYVHKRLDDAGVPVDPESTHKAEGCRIGGRLDLVLAALALAPTSDVGTVTA